MNKGWNWKWNGNQYYGKKARYAKLFWGLLLILMGIFLVISKMGLVTGISVWSVFFTIIFAAMLIRGLIKRNFFSIFFPIAFLCIIYDDQLGITALTPWTVLLAALLLSIGMEMLFNNSRNCYVKFFHNDDIDRTSRDNSDKGVHVGINLEIDDDNEKEESDEEASHTGWGAEESSTYGEKVFQSNNFSNISKYINPETFEKGVFTNSFGSMNVFFENVPTQKKEGYVNVSNSFGEINIYVPSSWLVNMMIEDTFGSKSSVKGRPDGSRTFLLHVNGDNSFGEVHIIYQ
ncbi:MAG: hypothetical protein HDR21_06350 [Lachnospiraceae bacterium]|nr:hypothetical protein [Lachnospiraceae bacterium]MBD5481980.1 hypothetical protein [Lachnospiraceae bacterium]